MSNIKSLINQRLIQKEMTGDNYIDVKRMFTSILLYSEFKNYYNTISLPNSERYSLIIPNFEEQFSTI